MINNSLMVRTTSSLHHFYAVFVIMLSVLPGISDAATRQGETRELMRQQIEKLRTERTLSVAGATVGAFRVIPELYERRNFDLEWRNSKSVDSLLAKILSSSDEGLDPEDYHYPTLVRLRSEIKSESSPAMLVNFDILLTESLIRLGYHLRFGKVNPYDLDPDWNLSREVDGHDPVDLFQSAIDAGSLGEYLDLLVPRPEFYKRYKKALVRYNKIKAEGGWPTVSQGPTLKPGMTDLRVVELRKRLVVEGDLKNIKATDSDNFDEHLEQAVIRFQERHGLDADGVIGKKTLLALNVSVEDRINQIKVNLERGRWVFEDVGGDFIIVNIAGYRAYLVQDDEVVWTTKVMVGKTYRKTPVFKSTMKYMVLNPTWTVPPGILRKDILPKASKDPDYIRNKNLDVIDRNGKKIDPDSLDWSSFTARNFPYQLRQPPGPKNALGLVKFMFPNPHLVYLHDTPNRKLFEHPERTFSSGCVRVENPFKLAELLLDDPDKWNQESLARVIDTKEITTVFLPEPLTVILLYWTAVVEPDGTVQFLNDVYKRDERILKALDGDFVVSLPKNLPDRYYKD
jgi:murein L,D-transpeptidase YcbB/YkuD